MPKAATRRATFAHVAPAGPTTTYTDNGVHGLPQVPEELSPGNRAGQWFEWEERPGPGPAQDVGRRSNERIIRVCYDEASTPLGG